jgi:hypothetical protein
LEKDILELEDILRLHGYIYGNISPWDLLVQVSETVNAHRLGLFEENLRVNILTEARVVLLKK